MAIVAIVYMLRQNRTPQSSVAWLLAIILCPWISVPLFFYLGGRKWANINEMGGYLTMTTTHEDEVEEIAPPAPPMAEPEKMSGRKKHHRSATPAAIPSPGGP